MGLIVPRWALAVGGAALLGLVVFGAGRWIEGERRDAFKAGAAEQKRVDETAFRAAQAKAETMQRAEVARVKAADAAAARRTEDALRDELDGVRRDADALRLRWQRARADTSVAGGGNLPGPASAAAIAADRACAAAGGIPFDLALPALEDAEADAAKLRGWEDWWRAVEEGRR